MLKVKFFQVNGTYYAVARHNECIIDRVVLCNVWEHTKEYIKRIMTAGYARNEIEFVLDFTLDNDAADSIGRDIAIYADEV